MSCHHLIQSRFITTLLVFFLFVRPAYSQKTFSTRGSEREQAEVINEWIQSIAPAYLHSDTLGSRGRSSIFFDNNHLLLNLLRDKYFVPVFGQPYAQFPEDKLEKIGKSLEKCLFNTKIGDEKRLPLNKVISAFSKGNQKFYVARLSELDRVKEKYNKQMAEMADESVYITNNFYEYSEQPFRSLLPTEIMAYLQQREIALNRTEYRKADEILTNTLNRAPSPETARKLMSFFTDNTYTAVGGLPAAKIAAFREKVDSRLSMVITSMMQDEEKKLAGISAGETGIINGNDFYIQFHRNYDGMWHRNEVSEIFRKYSDSRLATIASLKQPIELQISNASTVTELESIYDKYLSYSSNNDANTIRSLESSIENRKKILNSLLEESRKKATILIASRTKQQQEAYAQKTARQGSMLNFKDIVHVDYFRDAYLGNFEAYEQSALAADIPSNKPMYTFKMLIAAYSHYCSSALPTNKRKVEIKVLKTVGHTLIQRLGSRFPFSTITPQFDWVTIATFYMHPEFAWSFEHIPILDLAGNPIDIWTVSSYPDDFPQGILKDAATLISNNGCKHPGIYSILDNIESYQFRYTRPFLNERKKFTQANGYFFHKQGHFFEKRSGIRYGNQPFTNVEKKYNNEPFTNIERNYIDAPENFVPVLDYTPDRNKSHFLYVYHLVDSLSTGIKRVYVGPFAWRDLGLSFEGNKNRVTGFYEDPKSKERIPLPQDIKDELDKNMQDYFIVSVKYNRRNRGTLEGVAAAFWYGKGKVPSQRFQDFFKAYVGKPIEKLDFNYGD